ncbi:MAG: hypothetical protein QM802_15325 [Agriterribacter sp.]
MKRTIKYIAIPVVMLLVFACKKESFITSKDAALLLTADTLSFDTVFTSIGSTTQYFTIVNTNTQKLRLDKVKLEGGSQSSFKINVDGISNTEVNNIELSSGDSIYVFVSVTIDPSAANLPFIVRDSILVDYNGNQRYVQLQAYGQNAHFLKSKIIDANTTWQNDLPYVITGGVLVAEGVQLTIEKGCRIHIHANAPLLIDGTLTVNGTKKDSVTFQGDRLDDGYNDLPASWPGIYFSEKSKDNVINYGIVKNAYQGIIAVAPSPDASPKVVLNECVIDNIYDAGIIAASSSINAVNCLITNCGANINLTQGGTYNFTYCTIASYSNAYVEHKNAVVSMDNYDENGNAYPLSAIFRNCIIWGNGGDVDNEMVADKKGSTDFDVILDHSLYKAKALPSLITVTDGVANQDPAFDSINVNRRYFDFHINQKSSPAVGGGISIAVNTDLDGKERDAEPDIGCYEKQ